MMPQQLWVAKNWSHCSELKQLPLATNPKYCYLRTFIFHLGVFQGNRMHLILMLQVLQTLISSYKYVVEKPGIFFLLFSPFDLNFFFLTEELARSHNHFFLCKLGKGLILFQCSFLKLLLGGGEVEKEKQIRKGTGGRRNGAHQDLQWQIVVLQKSYWDNPSGIQHVNSRCIHRCISPLEIQGSCIWHGGKQLQGPIWNVSVYVSLISIPIEMVTDALRWRSNTKAEVKQGVNVLIKKLSWIHSLLATYINYGAHSGGRENRNNQENSRYATLIQCVNIILDALKICKFPLNPEYIHVPTEPVWCDG